MAWGNGYLYRTTAVVAASQITGTLTNFPALVSLSSTNLKTTGNGGAVQHTVTQTVGAFSLTVPADFLVTSDAAGATQITGVEFESYSASGGTALVWINVASAAVGSTIYIFYGNASVTTLQGTPSGAWNSAYVGVYHLPDGSSLTAADSTSNANNGTLTNTPTATTGKIDGGANFANATTQFIDLGTPSSLEVYSSLTVSAWIKTNLSNGSGAAMFVVSKDFSTGARGWGIGMWTDNTLYVEISGSPQITGGTTINDNVWHRIVAVNNAGTWTSYLDGAAKTTVSPGSPSANSSAKTYIRGREYVGFFGGFDGNVDQVEISNTNRSADWIAADYNNQNAPNTFWTLTYDVLAAVTDPPWGNQSQPSGYQNTIVIV